MRTRYKSLRVKYYSQAVLNLFSDKSQYMEEDIKNVYTHEDAMLKVDSILRHLSGQCLQYGQPSNQSPP
jgi:hypothetical protein